MSDAFERGDWCVMVETETFTARVMVGTEHQCREVARSIVAKPLVQEGASGAMVPIGSVLSARVEPMAGPSDAGPRAAGEGRDA